ncbi:dTDP-4-dehydrorhamnose 3,5-epimerase family protein [Rhodospirillales bacterium]|nr:dTDP-4-dehydrorhamnose 3,5-epimerase family protein [Rhodospirillales bacterium]
MFKIEETLIPGVKILHCRSLADERGTFTKIFHEHAFSENGLNNRWSESYVSNSKRGVVRGLHFQTPPADHSKLVYCVAGSVLDAVLDIRVGSPSYGKNVTVTLSADSGNAIFIPSGVAHGFCTPDQEASLLYFTSSVYDQQNDTGLLWDSAGIEWPIESPVTSLRDKTFPTFAKYKSPFTYESPQ